MLIVGFQGGSGGGGGSGINELTGDVLAGPGSGSVGSVVHHIAGFSAALFIDPAGDDVNGNGSFAAPFATYARCVAAFGPPPFFAVVFAGPGDYAENLHLFPQITLAALDPSQTTEFDGTIDLDPAFAAGGFAALSNLFLTGNIDIAFGAGGAGQLVLTNCFVESSSIVFAGGASSPVSSFQLNGGEYSTIHCSDGHLFHFGGAIIAGDLNLTTTAISTGYTAYSGAIDGNLNLTGSGGHDCVVVNFGVPIRDSVAINDTLSTYNTVGFAGNPGTGLTLAPLATLDQYIVLSSFKTLTYFQEVDNGNSGAAIAINWTRSNVQKITTNNATPAIAFSAPPSGPCNLTLHLFFGGVSSTPTWSPFLQWANNTPPNIAIALPHVIAYLYYDGTNYYGSFNSFV